MNKLVFDADALIKLAHAGVLRHIKQDRLMSQTVYEETVIEGKKQLYDDAYEIERLVQEGALQAVKTRTAEDIPGLGKGELSTLALFTQVKADAIISDDKKFLSVLEERQIPFIIPTELIAALVHKIGKKEAIEALRRIKPFVSEENYESASEALGGKK